MADTLYMTRMTLRRDAAASALLPLFVGDDGEITASAGKALVWTAFGDGYDGPRDFLWRETAPGTFLTLSGRTPSNAGGILHLDESKDFAPHLLEGTRLGFSLRANPVLRKPDGRRPGKTVKHDVMMDALWKYPNDERAAARDTAAYEAITRWLDWHGGRNGFEVAAGEFSLSGMRAIDIRKGKAKPISFTSVDIDGKLTVTDPDRFADVLRNGLGSARAYGCGMILIRRLPEE